MKKLFALSFISIAVFSCTNNSKEPADKKIALRTDTVNVVKLTDSLVIYENTCRGCEYEASTNFAISDSMNIIKLVDIITIDKNPPDMDGGTIRKNLVLVPAKTGTTVFKLYKFWAQEKTAADSARFATYKIVVN